MKRTESRTFKKKISSSSTSSSDSEDPNLALLKEAADNEFITDDMFNSESKREYCNQYKVLQSLRPQLQQDNFTDLIDITPECQQYIAKQLGKVLDEKLNQLIAKPRCSENVNSPKKIKSRVKLFKNSKHCIKPYTSKTFKPEKAYKRKLCDSDNEVEIQEKCRKMAVSGEQILSKQDLQHWSNRSKAEVFHYKKDTKSDTYNLQD